LQSEKSKNYYTGISSDPYRRLTIHNSIEKGLTSRYRPWKIVFLHVLDSKEKARKMRKELKA